MTPARVPITECAARLPMQSIRTPINKDDMERERHEYLFDLPGPLRQWVIKTLLKSEEEMPIFLVGFNILITSVPSAIGQFFLEGRAPLVLSVGLGCVYFALHLSTYAESFILGLHYATHVPIFKRRFRFLNNILPSILLCPFFGIPPNQYAIHHVAMHHTQDNIAPLDVSSTMEYQRDSRADHFRYMLRFVTAIWVELPLTMLRLRRSGLAAQCVMGEAAFFLGLATLSRQWPVATFFVFILPFLVISFALMQGNFKQHIFVDPDDPHNNYKSTFTCINTHTNSLNFNDGYHIEHHENSMTPWHRLPHEFMKNLPKHAKNDSFIFSGIGAMEVGSLVLYDRWDELADHYVNVGQPRRSKKELIAEFRRRVRPIKLEKSKC